MVKGLKHNGKRSNKGASLALTLLLFLICAALAAVVLAAGTAVAGRNANLTAADQRYYSVNSAAQLMREQLDGKTITLVRTHTWTETTTTTYNGASRHTSTSTSGDSYSAGLIGVSGGTEKSINAANLTLLEQVVSDVVLRGCSESATGPEKATYAWTWESNTSSATIDDYEFDLQHTVTTVPSGTTKANLEGALKANVIERIANNGDITFFITNDHANEYDDMYTLDLVFAADIDTRDEKTSSAPEVMTSGSGTNTVRTETSNITETKTTTFTWSVPNASKAGGGA